jgi:hypothetical protein
MAYPTGSTRLGMSETQWKQIAASKFRHEVPGSRKAAGTSRSPLRIRSHVSQQGRSATDGCALHGGDQWLLEIDQRLDQLRLGTFARCR